jgi:ABC-type transport system involved in cytochrome c biogenesis permease subunit
MAILALLIGASMVRNTHLTMPQSLRSAWLATHLTFALLSFALFVVAAAATLVYVVHERRLKAKTF